jgi:hypothetical protein
MKEHVIGFRISWNEYRQIEEQAEKRGEEVTEWCRKLVLSEAGKDFGMTASERILLEELAVIRNLVGRLLRETLSPEEMAKVRQDTDKYYVAFGRKLLEKRYGARTEAKDEKA